MFTWEGSWTVRCLSLSHHLEGTPLSPRNGRGAGNAVEKVHSRLSVVRRGSTLVVSDTGMLQRSVSVILDLQQIHVIILEDGQSSKKKNHEINYLQSSLYGSSHCLVNIFTFLFIYHR